MEHSDRTGERSDGICPGRCAHGPPFVLLAGVLAYLVGLAYAWFRVGSIDAIAAVYGLLVLMTATMMGHYADEYADLDTDSITRRTWFSGGSGVLPEGRLPPEVRATHGVGHAGDHPAHCRRWLDLGHVHLGLPCLARAVPLHSAGPIPCPLCAWSAGDGANWTTLSWGVSPWSSPDTCPRRAMLT